MKVELEKIRLAVTAISNNVVVSIPSKDGITMLHKHDVTSDFLQCIIDYGANTRFNIIGGGKDAKEFQVMVKEKNKYKNETFSRNEVIKFLSNAVKDGIGNETSVEQWIEKNLK